LQDEDAKRWQAELETVVCTIASRHWFVLLLLLLAG
jgi:hypothetical protein